MTKSKLLLLLVILLAATGGAYLYAWSRQPIVELVLDADRVLVPEHPICDVKLVTGSVYLYRLTEDEWGNATRMRSDIEKRGGGHQDYQPLEFWLWRRIFTGAKTERPSREVKLDHNRAEVRIKPGKYAIYSTPNLSDEGSGCALVEIPEGVRRVSLPAVEWYFPDGQYADKEAESQ